MRVEHGEVADNDWNRKSDSKDTGKSAQSADEHTGESFRCHIAVAYSGHRDQGPPEASRYAVKIVVRIFLKSVRCVTRATARSQLLEEPSRLEL